jgi:hypothetical protein
MNILGEQAEKNPGGKVRGQLHSRSWAAHTMQTTGTNPRRLLAISSSTFALGFGVWCLWYYACGPLYNPEGAFTFFGLALVHLTSAVTFLATARTRWRWTMLLLTIPCGLEFAGMLIEVSRWYRF